MGFLLVKTKWIHWETKSNLFYYCCFHYNFCSSYMYRLPSGRGWLWTPQPLILITLSNVCLLRISLDLCSAIHWHKVVRLITCCLPLFILPSICLVSVKFSEASFMIIFPGNFHCLLLIQSISGFFVCFYFVSIILKTSSLLRCSLHGILSILLLNDVSIATSLLFICEKIAQHSVP